MSKKGAKCFVCAGSGKISQSDSRLPLSKMFNWPRGVVRCNACGGTGRSK